MSKFEEAVEWILPNLSDIVRDRRLDLPPMDPMEFFLTKRLVQECPPPFPEILCNSASEKAILCVSEDGAMWLFEMAKKNAGAFDLAKKVALNNINYGKPLPYGLKSFVTKALLGSLKRPKASRRNKYWLRDVCFYVYANLAAKEFKLRLTRNDETKLENSACDAVVKALNQCGYSTTYRTVKEVCVRQKSKKLDAEFFKIISANHKSSMFEPLGWDSEQQANMDTLLARMFVTE